MTDKIQHWENVYSKKKFNDVSWYAPHLNESLALIQSLASNKNASIIDVGGGESTLVDDLLHQDYEQLSVLDISRAAITFTQNRLAENSTKVNWYIGDVTQIQLPEKTFDIWHDRAVFHFLTQEADRKAYVEQVKKTVKVGGYVVMATFGPEGPLQCSGLDVVRYTATDLHQQFDKGFELLGSDINTHQTPFNTVQQFLYCWCKVA
jgi:ubiquinone/menaquinone biosynthesis C-methylase UbiE